MIENKNISLENLNTFAIDAIASSMLVIESESDLIDLYDSGFFEKSGFIVLGGGSNIVFVDDVVQSPILKIEIKGLEIEDSSDSRTITAGAGENWHEFLEFCIRNQSYGMENLALIPGTVGAAPIQNIGAYGVEQENCFLSLRAFDVKSGQFISFGNDACQFAYRDSFFKRHKNQYIITSVSYKLSKEFEPNISYKDLSDRFDGVALNKISPIELFDAICDIRRKKIPYPENTPNAGSFFKNPELNLEFYDLLKSNFPDIGGFVNGDKIKVHAGKLIDLAGLKGHRMTNSNIGVSDKHALVLVNYGGGKGREIFELSEFIIDTVKSKFGIKLEREVNLV
ncbi:MAG: UDP-N-acetylenolpyruvoylglucosamine reductase [Ignavibacteriae bacterium HGW-Ignavibacteriae-1]|jgi:UDP-N-acetylmuramate dehydrogenase|nr:MAG: UDP-N-acetylenolpyruvoylglucosamine reductase [Ignavibacteriae bacterium HGW-Ignavibacteriae-1]